MNTQSKKIKLIKTFPVFLFVLLGITFIAASLANGVDKEQQTVKVETKQQTEPKSYLGKDWVLKNLRGEPVRLSDYQGRPVLLVFWATWCPYCKKLLPGIADLHKKYSAKGLKVIAVNIQEDWKPHVYWRNHEYQFEAVLEGDEVAKGYGVSGTPTVVFIEPTGKVIGVKSFSDPNHPLLEKFAQEYTKD